MDCAKCQGLMVEEPVSDGFVRMRAWRCVNCGALFDSVIGENQVRHRRRNRGSEQVGHFVADTMTGPPGSAETTPPLADEAKLSGDPFMKSISLVRMVGPCCSIAADGSKVNALIQTLLNEGNTVELDFHGVKLVTSSFYRAAVGDLTCSFPEAFVESHLSVSGLSDGITRGLEFLTAGVPKPRPSA